MENEKNISSDIKICYNCSSLHKTKDKDIFTCPICLTQQDLKKYTELLDISKKLVRYGYQYRERYEMEYLNDPKLNWNYYLDELTNLFAFVAGAMLNGIIGEFASEKCKTFFKKLKNDPLIIEIEDKEFKKLLENENEQEKFMRYIQEYRNGKIDTQAKVIEAIDEEIRADEKMKSMMESPHIKKIFEEMEKKEKSTKKKSTKPAKKEKKKK